MRQKTILLLFLGIYALIGVASLAFTAYENPVAACLSAPAVSAAPSCDVTVSDAKEETPKTRESVKEPAYAYTASHHTGRLFIRDGPSLENEIIGFLYPEASGTVISIHGEWVLLQHQESEGYVFGGYLTLTPIQIE